MLAGLNDMVSVGTDPAGHTLYVAAAGADTDGYFYVGQDGQGHAIFSESADAKVSAPAATGGGWFDGVTNFLTQGVVAYNQQKILDAQLELAKAGKPLLNTSQLGPTVNMGIATGTMNNLMMFGGAALLLLLFLGTKKR